MRVAAMIVVLDNDESVASIHSLESKNDGFDLFCSHSLSNLAGSMLRIRPRRCHVCLAPLRSSEKTKKKAPPALSRVCLHLLSPLAPHSFVPPRRDNNGFVSTISAIACPLSEQGKIDGTN
jgi:hypothetical protein